MAEIDNTTSGIVWQWLSEHKQDVLDYFSSIMREASDIQLVNFDQTRHMGLLATFVYQGVRRVDNVKPTSLLEGLTSLNEALRIRCENAAAEAETQAGYAKSQGDRVDNVISSYQALYTRVKNQGDTAEQQGANAQAICDNVTNWYTPFKSGAESWLSQTQAAWNVWYPSTQGTWNEWYQARINQGAAWFTNGIVPDWEAFWSGVQADWTDWTAKERARQNAELERIANELLRVADEETRKANELNRQSKESQRQQNEATRQLQEDNREAAEQLRQQTFETNEAQRQQDFEDAEDERMQMMLLTEAYIDFDDMSLNIMQPEEDSTDWEIDDCELAITIEYEDDEEEEP